MPGTAKLDAKLDVNKFYDVARKDIGRLMEGASVNASVIYNNSGEDVTFYVYNYIDTVYWIEAQKTRIADGHHGTVAASGQFFKIHPNSEDSQEFLVAPHEAYVYKGPGKVDKVD